MDKDFASRLKKTRMLQGYTQEQLAEITQISLTSIQRYEQQGEYPNSEYLLTLAEALDVTAEFLLKGTNKMKIYTSAIAAELKQIRSFYQLKQIKDTELNSTILSHLELSEDLVTEIQEEWMRNQLFTGSCYRSFVKDIILKYCQNRKQFRELFKLEDGTLKNIGQ